ncbi:MAG: sensor domain-containing diguanylate cyclase [Hominilimicola sp.]
MQFVRKLKLNDVIIATALIILGLCVTILFACGFIKIQSESQCYDSLKNATEQIRYEICSNISSDTEQLEIIANIISNFDVVDSEETKMLITNFEGSRMFTHLEMLLPDDRVITSNGRFVPSAYSFQTEVAKGKYLSDITYDMSHGNKKVLRNSVPVIKNGKTQAILYGVIELEKLPECYQTEIYMGNSSMYIIDGTSGDFIMDTWHNSLSNIDELEERNAKRGYNTKTMNEDLRNGRSGYTAFKSNIIGEYLYAYYTPVGVNNWMIMLTVPESAVFGAAYQAQGVLYIMAAIMILIMSVYFIWLLGREKREKKRVKYMLAVEKKLFSAHRKQKNINDALYVVAETLYAESAFFAEFDNDLIRHISMWTEKAGLDFVAFEGRTVTDVIPSFTEMFEAETSKIKYGRDIFVLDKNTAGIEYRINSYMLVAVKDADDMIVGILGVTNLKKKWKDARLLENVALTFSVAVYNLQKYNIIKGMGIRDSLTDLLNRNAFENLIEKSGHTAHKNLTCAYIDVNGLHDLNNSQGHEEGDCMLKIVADSLKSEIDTDNLYRIGGDEFLAFIENKDKKQAYTMIDSAERLIKKNGYSVAVGIVYSVEEHNVSAMVKRAEGKMLEAKYNHYRDKTNNSDGESDVTEWNSDTILSIIEPDLKVAYIINLDSDKMMNIFLPLSFRYDFVPSGNKFSADMEVYIKNNVSKEDWEKVLGLLDYEKLDAALNIDNIVKMEYRKKDGKLIKARIYKSPDYQSCSRETVWVFEN